MPRFASPRHAAARWFAPLVMSLAVACGEGDVGEDCDESGSLDECVDGAICTNEGDGAICRGRCEEQQDCPENHACNGVSNSNLKSCQPDG